MAEIEKNIKQQNDRRKNEYTYRPNTSDNKKTNAEMFKPREKGGSK